MQTRTLGHSGLKLSTIGLGTWAMGGGDWKFGWGAQDDQKSIAAVRAAVEAGINWIDTAAIYGHGHSEKVVGQAIKERRNDLIIATKCGRVWAGESREIGKCLRRESIFREVENSLTRLQIDVIDLYQIHWPEPDDEVEEGWSAVGDLIKAGKVRFGGVCNFNLAQLKRAQAIHPITSLQPPYSMLKRDIEPEIIPWCAENNVGIVAYSPMQAGLLTGRFTKERAAALPENDWRKRSPFFQEPQLSANLRVAEGLMPIADRMSIAVSQLALAWVLRLPAVTAAIAGARDPRQIQETARAGDVELSPEVIEEIEKLLRQRESELQ
ncbi:aldo/keto reductase [bacterium]|nr:aldo/keto reductase [bacterium]